MHLYYFYLISIEYNMLKTFCYFLIISLLTTGIIKGQQTPAPTSGPERWSFLARNRHFDMFEILELYADLLGIGLDENTAIHVTSDTFEVVGQSYVAIYDRSLWSAERNTTYQMPADSKKFNFLHRGQRYDMRNRKVIR